MKTLYIIFPPSPNFHPLGLFKDKHSKEQNFSNINLRATSTIF
jgi:hypothetical protein